jgi:hypothetical protein
MIKIAKMSDRNLPLGIEWVLNDVGIVNGFKLMKYSKNVTLFGKEMKY